MNFVVNTGNAQRDQEELARYHQHYQAQGLQMQAQPLPTGGFQVTVGPAQSYGAPPQQAYGAPPQQAYGAAQPAYGGAPQQPYGMSSSQPLGGPAYATAGGGAIGGAATQAVAPLSDQRVAYLRKVYGLLGASAFVAVFAGWAAISLGPTVELTAEDGTTVAVPALVALMLDSPAMMWGAFGLLFVSTFVASAVSKVRVVNVIALLGVATLMGVQLAPMAFVAQYAAGLGGTLSANPIRDTMVMVLCVFTGITAYIFTTRKDFSWMKSIVSMGFMVVFGACILSFFFESEAFSLAVASTGALLSIATLLYVTSYIFRNSEMDDPVGDALSLLVQLRNLFMFLLRIFMSRR
jgi:FtsH-binding integral membrane protein